MSKEELEFLSAVDLDEYYDEQIVAHEENGKNSIESDVQGQMGGLHWMYIARSTQS